MNLRKTLPRLVLITLASYGAIAGGALTLKHMQQGEICPLLGPVPACYVVFAAYLCILISAVRIAAPYASKLFFVGWIPAVGLAFVGVGLELTQGHLSLIHI